MTPEELFLRYAIGCLEGLVCSGDIDGNAKDNLEQRFFNAEPISRDELENVYHVAFDRLRTCYGDDLWTVDNVRDYFLKKHNHFVDSTIKSESIRYWCKVRAGVVCHVDSDFAIIAYPERDHKLDESTRFFNRFKLNLKRGDKVVLHWRYIVEKV